MQGIENLGSTCAINSLIQIITRNEILRNIILNNNFADNTISDQLKEIINLMYVQNNSIIPRKFLNTFYTIFKDIFYSGEQIDIGELWTFLSDKVSEEIEGIVDTSKDKNKKDIKMLEEDQLTEGVVYNDDKELHNAMINCKLLKKKYEYYYNKFNKKTSMWQKSTQGFYLNTTRCVDCNLTFYNFEPFTSLNIDIPKDITHPKISDMISKSLKEEVIQGDWFCSKCNKNRAYKKSTKLWKLPDVLVIIIKRFINIHLKNDAPISINDYLNFNKGSILSNKKDVVYNFSSVALHFGSLNGGHYSAICNTPDGDILYDDRNVIKINIEDMNFKEKSSNAYMLVYTKKKEDK
uniref:USP domain-containing protein n=1 Tax=viral metagenome TaxID=1070528 RepID=A0A6C0L9F9_9ZZZZ